MTWTEFLTFAVCAKGLRTLSTMVYFVDILVESFKWCVVK